MNAHKIGWGILWFFLLIYALGVLVNFFQTA